MKPNYVIITRGFFKGIAGEILSMEFSLFEEAWALIRVYDITEYSYDYKEIKIPCKYLQPITEEQYRSFLLKRREEEMQINCKDIFNAMLTTNNFNPSTIKNVIFNDPATIVIWTDETKTIVKCQKGDTFSKETGLAMAIIKKCMGNKSNYNDVFEKWIEDNEDK